MLFFEQTEIGQSMPNALGQFMAGHSGNAGGRPKDEHKEAELARSCALEAIETLVALMRSGKSERIRGTAAQALPERGWDEIIVRYSERLASLAIPV